MATCTSADSILEAAALIKANGGKIDKFTNGTDTETVQLGLGAATPVLRNVVRQMLSAGSEIEGTDASGKFVVADGGSESRTLAARFSDVVNVMDFGAAGDGTADDAPAIQAALDAASGRTLFFPDGVYRVEDTLLIPSLTRLEGSPGTSIKKDFSVGPSGYGSLATFKALDGETTIHDISIRGILFDGNGTARPTQPFDILIFGSLPVYDVLIENCTFKDVVDYHSIDMMYSCRVHIKNCNFIGFSNPGASTGGWADNKRESIQFDLGDSDDLFVNNKITIEQCYFGPSENFGAPTVGIGNHGHRDTSDGCSDIIIKDNIFDGMSFAGIAMVCLKNVVVEGNIIKTTGNGITITARHNSSLNVKAICENILISENLIERTGGSSGVGVYIWCSAGADIANPDDAMNRNIRINNNLIKNMPIGVRLLCAEEVTISDNTFVNSYISGGARHLKIRCNEFYSPSNAVYLNAGDTSMTVAKNNAAYNLDWDISCNSFYNPALRAIHVTGNGKKDIFVCDNKIVDTMDSTSAASVNVSYISIDSSRTNVVCSNNYVLADNARGRDHAFDSSESVDYRYNNVYYINGSAGSPYGS